MIYSTYNILLLSKAGVNILLLHKTTLNISVSVYKYIPLIKMFVCSRLCCSKRLGGTTLPSTASRF